MFTKIFSQVEISQSHTHTQFAYVTTDHRWKKKCADSILQQMSTIGLFILILLMETYMHDWNNKNRTTNFVIVYINIIAYQTIELRLNCVYI